MWSRFSEVKKSESACPDCGSEDIRGDTCYGCGSVLDNVLLIEEAYAPNLNPTRETKTKTCAGFLKLIQKYEMIPLRAHEDILNQYTAIQREFHSLRPKRNSLCKSYVLQQILNLMYPGIDFGIDFYRTPAKLQSYDMIFKEISERLH